MVCTKLCELKCKVIHCVYYPGRNKRATMTKDHFLLLSCDATSVFIRQDRPAQRSHHLWYYCYHSSKKELRKLLLLLYLSSHHNTTSSLFMALYNSHDNFLYLMFTKCKCKHSVLKINRKNDMILLDLNQRPS